MNKNTVLAWATTIMIVVGLGLIALGAFRYDETSGSYLLCWLPNPDAHPTGSWEKS